MKQHFTDDGGCRNCGSKKVIRKTHYVEYNKFLGKIEFDYTDGGEYGFYYCKKCGYIVSLGGLDFCKDETEMTKVEELLREKYPVESNEYLTFDEMKALSYWDCRCYSEKVLNWKIYNLVHNGIRLYLKKSWEIMCKQHGTGHFKLID